MLLNGGAVAVGSGRDELGVTTFGAEPVVEVVVESDPEQEAPTSTIVRTMASRCLIQRKLPIRPGCANDRSRGYPAALFKASSNARAEPSTTSVSTLRPAYDCPPARMMTLISAIASAPDVTGTTR